MDYSSNDDLALDLITLMTGPAPWPCPLTAKLKCLAPTSLIFL